MQKSINKKAKECPARIDEIINAKTDKPLIGLGENNLEQDDYIPIQNLRVLLSIWNQSLKECLFQNAQVEKF